MYKKQERVLRRHMINGNENEAENKNRSQRYDMN